MSPLSIKNSNHHHHHHFHSGNNNRHNHNSSSSFDIADNDGISKLKLQQPPSQGFDKGSDDHHHRSCGNLSPVPPARVMTMIPVSPPPAAAVPVACGEQQEPPLSSESTHPEEVEVESSNTKTVFTTEMTAASEREHQPPTTPSRTSSSTTTKSRIVVADYTSRNVDLPDYDVNNDLDESFVPSDHDVICGWARQNYNHGGNKKLRHLIESNIKAYTNAATKTDKGQVIVNIVEQIRRESPTGVGMVKLNSSTGRWAYIGTNKAKDKIGHGTYCFCVLSPFERTYEKPQLNSRRISPIPSCSSLQLYEKHPKRTRRSNRSCLRRESSKPKKRNGMVVVVAATRGGILRNTILRPRRRHRMKIILGRRVSR